MRVKLAGSHTGSANALPTSPPQSHDDDDRSDASQYREDRQCRDRRRKQGDQAGQGSQPTEVGIRHEAAHDPEDQKRYREQQRRSRHEPVPPVVVAEHVEGGEGKQNAKDRDVEWRAADRRGQSSGRR